MSGEFTRLCEPRDRLGRLRCRVPGCRHAIAAFTGLQELQKLIAHYRRAHLAHISMSDALEIRAAWEQQEG